MSELAANAVLHGRPPIQLRLRRTATHVVLGPMAVAVGAAAVPNIGAARPTPRPTGAPTSERADRPGPALAST